MARCELVRCTPESVGLSSRKLLEMVKKLESCGTEMHGLMVTRHGKVVLEGWWAPHTKDTIHICHSFGKSYVATAVGAACTDGLMSVEDRVADLFRDDLKAFGVADEGNLSRLKVKHVLSMTNGMKVHALAGKDLVRNYLTTAVDFEPGSVFMYNTAGSCMLGEMVRRVTGRSVYDYMKERVFDPIGIDTDHLRWMTFEGGLHAAPGVASTTENNLRLGMLYLQNGQWDGRQIIDPEWIKAATVKQIDNHLCGYGYQLWMNSPPESFRFCGGHGQDCIMSRPQDIAVSITQAGSEPHDTDATLSIINEYLLTQPLPDVLPGDEAAQAELAAYMESRRVVRCARLQMIGKAGIMWWKDNSTCTPSCVPLATSTSMRTSTPFPIPTCAPSISAASRRGLSWCSTTASPSSPVWTASGFRILRSPPCRPTTSPAPAQRWTLTN